MALTFSFPGVTAADIHSVNAALSVGFNPGRVSVTCRSGVAPGNFGSLSFGDGTRTITLPLCRLVSRSLRSDGKQLLVFEDQRWRWRFGVINGRYNFREGDNSTLIAEKTPRELAALLAAELNETIDATNLPNDPRPAVNWYAANPGQELAKLCGDLGCTIAPDGDGTWTIHKLGVGSLITGLDAFVQQAAIDSIARPAPEQIAVATGAVQYEVVFALRAVGRDTNGQLKPIDDLSYKPVGGWEAQDPSFYGVTGTYTDPSTQETLNNRDLARENVWRLYQVHTMPAGTGANSLNPPGYPLDSEPDIENLNQLLPIRPVTNESADWTVGIRAPRRPAEVWGVYATQSLVGLNTASGTRVRTNFQIDGPKGLIQFAEPLYRDDPTGRTAAELYLRCVVEVTDPTLNQKLYYAKYENTGQLSGAGAEVIKRPDLSLRYEPTWAADGTIAESGGSPIATGDNLTAINAECDYHLSNAADVYDAQSTGMVRLAGIHGVALDGLRQDISWAMGVTQEPSTSVGLNSATSPYRPDYVQEARLVRDRAAATLEADTQRQQLVELLGQGGSA